MSNSVAELDIKGKEALDFPAFLPSLLVKELRQGIRTKAFIFSMILLPVAMAFPFILHVIIGENGRPLLNKSELEGFFWTISIFSIMAVNPARALWSVHQEKSTRSSDLLVLTHLSARRIAFQKWVSYAIQTLLLMSILCPYLVLRYFLGGVELYNDALVLFFSYLFSLGLTSIALMFSGMPIFYRILAIVGIVAASIFFMAFVLDSGALSEPLNFEWMVVVSLASIVSAVAWVCALFITLAAKHFAAAAENISAPLRKLLLYGGVPGLCLAYSSLFFDASEYHGFQAAAFLTIVIIYGIMCLFEMVETTDLQSNLVEKRLEGRGIWARFLTPFLLPGWQSASLFTFVSVLLFIPAMAQIEDFHISSRDPFLFFSGLGLALWASAVFLIVVLKSILKKVGAHALLVFLLSVGIIMVLCSITWQVSRSYSVMALFPVGNIWAIVEGKASLLSWLSIGIGTAFYMVGSFPYWLSYDKIIKRLYKRQSVAEGDSEQDNFDEDK